MSRAIGAALVALALCSATAKAGESAGGRGPDPKVPFLGGFLQQTQILYPLRVGEWNAQGEKRYDVQRDGVSVRYTRGDTADEWLDVFFYPVGVVEPTAWSATAAAEHSGVADARRRAGFEVEPGRLAGFRIGKGEAAVDGYASDFAFGKDGQHFHSALVLAYDRLYIVKGRLSAPSAVLSRREARKTLESFFRAMWPDLVIASRGHCWNPLPVERLDTVPRVEDVMATQEQDGTVNAYLMRDRVLAADPGSPEAHAMLLLGMAMQGRLFDGCVSVDSETREAGEGQREIRIEYRPEPQQSGTAAASPAGGA